LYSPKCSGCPQLQSAETEDKIGKNKRWVYLRRDQGKPGRACIGGKGRLRRTSDRQRHELEPRLCGISGPSDPVPSVRLTDSILLSSGLLRLRPLEGYHRQLADRVELFPHFHMLVFASDARRCMTGDRVGNPLGDIAGK
jgi:hypothetical protein